MNDLRFRYDTIYEFNWQHRKSKKWVVPFRWHAMRYTFSRPDENAEKSNADNRPRLFRAWVTMRATYRKQWAPGRELWADAWLLCLLMYVSATEAHTQKKPIRYMAGVLTLALVTTDQRYVEWCQHKIGKHTSIQLCKCHWPRLNEFHWRGEHIFQGTASQAYPATFYTHIFTLHIS